MHLFSPYTASALSTVGLAVFRPFWSYDRLRRFRGAVDRINHFNHMQVTAVSCYNWRCRRSAAN